MSEWKNELLNPDFAVGFVAKVDRPIYSWTLGVYFPQTYHSFGEDKNMRKLKGLKASKLALEIQLQFPD